MNDTPGVMERGGVGKAGRLAFYRNLRMRGLSPNTHSTLSESSFGRRASLLRQCRGFVLAHCLSLSLSLFHNSLLLLSLSLSSTSERNIFSRAYSLAILFGESSSLSSSFVAQVRYLKISI